MGDLANPSTEFLEIPLLKSCQIASSGINAVAKIAVTSLMRRAERLNRSRPIPALKILCVA